MKILTILILPTMLTAARVSTGQYDNFRSNANTAETNLTQANVTAGKFGRLGSYSMDGPMYAQPLTEDVTISGHVRRLLIGNTTNGTIYAFDAASVGSTIWSRHVGDPFFETGSNMGGPYGCWSTPVIDTGTQILYAVCGIQDVDLSCVQKLYAINLVDGTDAHTPVRISATSGSATWGCEINANKSALALANGNIYISFLVLSEPTNTIHGWVLAYDKTTGSQTGVWVSTPTGPGPDDANGGIWMSGGGPAIDGSGNVYVITGNGEWDGTSNYGDSFVKLSPTLSLLSYGTPANEQTLDDADGDLGSGRVILTGSFLMGGGKDGRWWLMNQADLGGLQGRDTGPVQVWNASLAEHQRSIAFANGNLYIVGPPTGFDYDGLARYTFDGSTFNTTPAAKTGDISLGGGDGTITYSSNTSASGTDIIWLMYSPDATRHLKAFNATTMGLLFDYTMPDGSGRESGITIDNGMVFVPATNKIAAFGLLGSSQTRGLSSIRGTGVVR